MVQALVDAASGNGARKAFGSSVSCITIVDRTVTSVELDDGEAYVVDKIVNAAGPAAQRIAALVGRNLPMRDSPGLAIRLATNSELVGRVIHAPGIAIRPDGPVGVFVLARGVEPKLRKTGHGSREVIEQVGQLAAGVVPKLAGASVADVRVGHRPMPFDGRPLIGRVGDIRGYYEAVTHSGITLGPIIGRALTAEILYDQIDPLVSSFRASRFP
jgi:glycine/D-amino acid oxidase-like deaminating enzyme